MKKIRIIIAFLAAITISGSSMAQTEQKEQLVVPLSDPGKPFKLSVGLVNGSIKVTAYEGKDVIIDVTAEHPEKKNRESSNGMKRITAGNGLDVSAEEKNNRININTESYRYPVNLSIKVPQSEATLRLSTVNDGDIIVTNVSGEMEVENVNGPIKLVNVSGSAVVTSVNGNVVAIFKNIDAKAAMAFTTLNGNVDVTFPASLKANVKLKSDQGEMFTDFDIAADNSKPQVSKTDNKGMHRVNIESWVYGKINAGGPELMMKNMNGNIYIRKAKS